MTFVIFEFTIQSIRVSSNTWMLGFYIWVRANHYFIMASKIGINILNFVLYHDISYIICNNHNYVVIIIRNYFHFAYIISLV